MKIITFSAHDNPSLGGGIVSYCKALEKLFREGKNLKIIESEILPHKSIIGLRYNKKRLINYIMRERPDIIHLNGYTSLIIKQLVPIAKNLGIKLVYTPHWHPFNTMRKPLMKRLYFNFFIRPFLKDMDAIVCINNEDYSFFSNFSRKTHLIPHWLDEDIPAYMNVKRVDNQILFVGSLTHSNKGFQYLNNLPRDKYKIICVGRGDVSLRSDMTRLYRISDENLQKLYYQSSLVVIPSKYEAFSYVALEALNAGTPVVMSERVRIGDFLKGFEGIEIFDLTQPAQFACAVKRMIGRRFNNKYIKDFFSANKARENYLKLYNSL